MHAKCMNTDIVRRGGPLLQPPGQPPARANAEEAAAAESAGERGRAPRDREGPRLGERRLSWGRDPPIGPPGVALGWATASTAAGRGLGVLADEMRDAVAAASLTRSGSVQRHADTALCAAAAVSSFTGTPQASAGGIAALGVLPVAVTAGGSAAGVSATEGCAAGALAAGTLATLVLKAGCARAGSSP